MSDDDAPAHRRAHREKRRRGASGRVDPGAVAVGLLGPLVVATVVLSLRPSPASAAALFVVGVGVGGYIAGRAMSQEASCGPCHGALVGVCASVITGSVGIAARFASTGAVSFGVLAWDRSVLIAAIAGGFLLAVIGGWRGGARKS